MGSRISQSLMPISLLQVLGFLGMFKPCMDHRMLVLKLKTQLGNQLFRRKLARKKGAEALILQPSDFILSHKAYIMPNTLSLVYAIPRAKTESCAPSSSKACRQKQRRDKLNDKFVELGVLLEPGRPPKTDKAASLVDAVRMVTQIRGEAEKLKDSNLNLQEKIKELKAEKNELRDEKQKLKAEKEKLEQQMKAMGTSQQGFFHTPPAISPAFAAQNQAVGNKLVPIISYPGVAMWQFMPPAAVDTSQDHVLHPPVA